MDTRDAILARLRALKERLRADYGVAEIGVFGSVVRGEEAAESDVDIMVEFSEPIGFFRFLEMEERLAQELGRGVDLVSKKALKPRIGARILQEVVNA
jgi:predicted nucleotidyltransferase